MPSALPEAHQEFLDYLAHWPSTWKAVSLRDLDPTKTAMVCVDLLQGFCHTGPLSSPRVAGIVAPIVQLFSQAYTRGVRDFILVQDSHSQDAEEFSAWPAHCIRDSLEAEPVPELAKLPFAKSFTVLPKNSISASQGTGLDQWLQRHPQATTFLTVGDCTDLCLYQLAMHLRLRSNALGLGYRVIAPAECIETYDLPIAVAQELGALPHPGDLFHTLFLYHLALNGVEVVRAVAA